MIKEEVKEAQLQNEFSGLLENKVLPCFDFYKNLETLNIDDLQFKKNFKYTITHPY